MKNQLINEMNAVRAYLTIIEPEDRKEIEECNCKSCLKLQGVKSWFAEVDLEKDHEEYIHEEYHKGDRKDIDCHFCNQEGNQFASDKINGENK